VDANLHLGLPIDERDYAEAAEILATLGVSSVRLITNNPIKVRQVRESGIEVGEVVGIPVAAHAHNIRYLSTKRDRLGHTAPLGSDLREAIAAPVDVAALIGSIRPRARRPYVVVKYAQSLDGRTATATGDSKWISGESERSVSHALRAHCDAIMVGVGTVIRDDPQLTVRLVPGASPIRVVLDSTLRAPPDAKVFDDDAATLVVTTEAADPGACRRLSDRGVGLRVVPRASRGVDLPAALAALRDMGVESVIVEGGARVVTSLLKHQLIDRMIVSIAPKLLGKGTEAVGDLGIAQVAEGLELTNRSVHVTGDDVLVSCDVGRSIDANGNPGAPGQTLGMGITR
jgi:3,4-dihydroxy 2-butanone 4-phosphate synthase/GTP cyclohydrolase II